MAAVPSRLVACSVPMACAVSHIVRVMIGGWVGSGDHSHWVFGDLDGPAAGQGAGAAEHHVTGVLGVAQDRVDGGLGPHPGFGGRGVALRVGGQPLADGVAAEPVTKCAR